MLRREKIDLFLVKDNDDILFGKRFGKEEKRRKKEKNIYIPFLYLSDLETREALIAPSSPSQILKEP